MKSLSPIFTFLFAAVVAATAPTAALAQDVKGDAKAGERKIAACIGCHGITGYQATFPEIYKVPKISGQGAKYIAAALHAYQKGERKHPSMRGIAETLSDQDIADLAAYDEARGATASAAPATSPNKRAAASAHRGRSRHGDRPPRAPRPAPPGSHRSPDTSARSHRCRA